MIGYVYLRGFGKRHILSGMGNSLPYQKVVVAVAPEGEETVETYVESEVTSQFCR